MKARIARSAAGQTPSPPRRGRRSRHGYERLWSGEASPAIPGGGSYFTATRKPLPCLIFVAPFLLVYELGVLRLGATARGVLRTGADAWMRQGLAALGLTDQWPLPLALVLILLAWQAFGAQDWRFSPWSLLGMAVESLLLAVALVGLSRVVDLGFSALERAGPVRLDGSASATLLGFLGAGIYEEALFRLVLIPLFYGVLRMLQTPQVVACSVAVTASSLLFSLAHHAGMPGEAFTWYAFVFRWLAGVYFAWVFVARGFGIAVGSHTAYDVMVGWWGWHF